MFILVPPSEGKTAPTDAEPLVHGSLVLPELTAVRVSLMKALSRLSSGSPTRALAALGLSEGQLGELTHNQLVATAPAAPAADVYRGVLYEALDLPGLRTDDPEAYRRAQESLLVFSGLWGVVRPQDRIPYYRCSAGVKLPRIGSVTAVWKKALAGPLADLAGEKLVVDLRSTGYTGMWRPTGSTVTVRVVHERVVGGVLKRSVVSHFNKATKGRLVRALLVAGEEPKTPEEFADALRDLGFRVECGAAGAGALDVVVAEL
ncbi:MAG TPA: peroxide stress protein YaaA [Actinocrinis sp.]|uniref:YaaA family protein n=1 Tax=Actinocrinis sp. TaxID=1920516 RepID=UPI002DDD3E73|nr:peroxide stress protein YaaA [Actinocrinis sp.]HEV2347151.1 peroxide stress protein YaaA [Actinocrinis sp.]